MGLGWVKMKGQGGAALHQTTALYINATLSDKRVSSNLSAKIKLCPFETDGKTLQC